jgi:hypothetical protein
VPGYVDAALKRAQQAEEIKAQQNRELHINDQAPNGWNQGIILFECHNCGAKPETLYACPNCGWNEQMALDLDCTEYGAFRFLGHLLGRVRAYDTLMELRGQYQRA